jgi:L-rhamnose mutarotase
MYRTKRFLRRMFLRTFRFIPAVGKKYKKMKENENFKADEGYVEVAKSMKNDVYPVLFEAIEKCGVENITIKLNGLKKIQIDRHGFCFLEDEKTANGWYALGNAKEDSWDPIFRLCHNRDNIMSYPIFAEGVMDKLDEMLKHGVKNSELVERSKKFGEVFNRKVVTEKHKQ